MHAMRPVLLDAGEAEQFTVKMLVGCSLAMLGFCLYSHVKMNAAFTVKARGERAAWLWAHGMIPVDCSDARR
jgi:hypothetical protein